MEKKVHGLLKWCTDGYWHHRRACRYTAVRCWYYEKCLQMNPRHMVVQREVALLAVRTSADTLVVLNIMVNYCW